MTTPSAQIERKLEQLRDHVVAHNCSAFFPDASMSDARACCQRVLSAELLARPTTDQYSHVVHACRPRVHTAPSYKSSAKQWDMKAARAKLVADDTARRTAEARRTANDKLRDQKRLKGNVKFEAGISAGGLAIGAAGATTAVAGQAATAAGLISVGEALEGIGGMTVEFGGAGAVLGLVGMGINAVGLYEATH